MYRRGTEPVYLAKLAAKELNNSSITMAAGVDSLSTIKDFNFNPQVTLTQLLWKLSHVGGLKVKAKIL